MCVPGVFDWIGHTLFLEGRLHSCLSYYSLYLFMSEILNTLNKCLKERAEEWKNFEGTEFGKQACACLPCICTRGGTQHVFTTELPNFWLYM